ncbi:MAG: NADH-quinone oxidoreductase subunit J [Parachlamydiaceae bacterium]|nr:NADH-quinone oxidoreductase subunit J [Parachlamydiaceae bacterium]
MMFDADPIHWIFGSILILSSLGVILLRKPVHASLSFLMTLLALSGIYSELSAHFIAVMQILVYAGAILVIFIFVMVLFQDAHAQLGKFKPLSNHYFLWGTGFLFLLALFIWGIFLRGIIPQKEGLPENYGTVQSLGHVLYIDFFFPFEAVILLFLVAIVGSLYIAKKEI